LTRGQTKKNPEKNKLRNRSIQDVWDLHEAGEVHLVYLVVDTELISFEKKQLEIKDGRLWIVEVEKNATQGWKNQHELMSWKRGLVSLLE
jgi:U3 small nucleolar ribonucleoprotein component